MQKAGITTRREFLGTAAAGAALAWAGSVLAAQDDGSATGIPTRPLGRTGVRVSILCLGGWHIGRAGLDHGEKEAIHILHRALDEGITFWDNAWDYHDGYSEELMGKALKGRRDRVFLMTKNCERDYQGSKKNLEDSLRRLQTDHIDLWQFHEIVYDNDPDWVLEKGGLRAALDAQKEGKVRFIGFTGHKDPQIHLKMLRLVSRVPGFDWHTSQMPINIMDAHYRSFQNEVIPVCLERGIGVIGMKSLAGGYPRGRLPQEGIATAEECIRYALSLEISSLVCGIVTMEDLEQDIRIARNFKPMTASEMDALRARVRDEATDGRHELFKSTKVFDGPHHRKQHGFSVDIPA
jgi:aryl-alcohol dehydrogenase-like predicted oxidoreductase